MSEQGTTKDLVSGVVTQRTLQLFAELRANGHGEIADAFDRTLREIERQQQLLRLVLDDDGMGTRDLIRQHLGISAEATSSLESVR